MDGMAGLAWRADDCTKVSDLRPAFAFESVIADICALPWESLDDGEVVQVAKAYYYFSVQFRENLETACRLYPRDAKLRELREGECDTDNLSPWPGVAMVGERLNHDEFMQRLLALQPVAQEDYLAMLGERYLERVRALSEAERAASIASYEDTGLSRVFHAMLRAPQWRGAGALAFKFFLEEHIRFDSDDDGGHGSLSRHLRVDDGILPLWVAFRELLIAAVPKFWQTPGVAGERPHSLAIAA